MSAGSLGLEMSVSGVVRGKVVMNKMNLVFSPHPQGRNVVPFHKTSVQRASL